jgi:hypothetical protein
MVNKIINSSNEKSIQYFSAAAIRFITAMAGQRQTPADR